MKLPKYVSLWNDRHGRQRLRFRQAGKTIYMQSEPFTDDFWLEYARLIDGAARPPKAPKVNPESLEWLIIQFIKSPKFQRQAKNTKANKTRIYRRMIESAGQHPYRAITKDVVRVNLNERAETPSAAKHWLRRAKLKSIQLSCFELSFRI